MGYPWSSAKTAETAETYIWPGRQWQLPETATSSDVTIDFVASTSHASSTKFKPISRQITDYGKTKAETRQYLGFPKNKPILRI